jgi:hypothetical protein
MKSFTTVEQSKMLAKILSLESADMFLAINGTLPVMSKYIDDGFVTADNTAIPCWSLSALLSLIPQEIFDGEYIINITEGCDNKWILTYDHHENRNHSYYGLSTGADNLVDACTDIIIKLKERNII